jgi:hypothetical protein
MSEKADKLLSILSAEEVQRAFWESGLNEFSAEERNEAVARVARTSEPAPPGRLLARLLFIVTDQNKPDMIAAFLANLNSPDPDARKASLYGLQELGNPGVTDFALAALRDSSDQVITAACTVLLPQAKQDPRLWTILRDLYAAHQGKTEFHMSNSFLQAHGAGE